MKKILCFLVLTVLMFNSFCSFVFASSDEKYENSTNNEAEYQITGGSNLNISAKSAILMDAETGAILYQKNKNDALPPASVTKIMTLLLVAEAIDDGRLKLDDKVSVSENAASMGGSQIFIKEGEEFTVDELLKSTVIASANDAAVALAELISGSESAFVDLMNKKASDLGLKDTVFENATGLDDTVTKHLTSAYDIAFMSKELLKYDFILKYSSLWQDSIRNGEFILTNTNRLVRFYSGCTGLKTGSTDKAGFCVSATAKRGNMHLIAVIMGAETRDIRNNEARMLLDYGFANYSVYNDEPAFIENIPVVKGVKDQLGISSVGFTILINKSDEKRIEKKYNIPEQLTAPISKGDVVGEIIYTLDDKVIGKSNIIADEDIDKISFFEVFVRVLRSIFVGK